MLVLFSILSLICYGSNGAGFDYPAEMPEPNKFQNAVFLTRTPYIEAYETPIRIRFTSILTTTVWNCLAVYHPTVLDAIRRDRPIVVPTDDIINMYGTEEIQWLCAAYALLIVDSYILPEYGGSDEHIELMKSLHLDFDEEKHFEVNDEIEECGIHNQLCLQSVAEKYNFIPEIMGSIVALQSIDYLDNDGWNQFGEDAGCTANCRAYSDTTGYKPNFYRPNRWVPLVEDNGKGFFYHYDHVTPHIGFTTTTKVLTRDELDSRTAPRPKYNYKEEINLVIDRLADLATNDTQKMLVEFFDDKLRVAESMIFTLDNLLDWSYAERQLYLMGVNQAEYDSVILAWKEKVNHDLIRPTSLIKRKGRKKIQTYGGPKSDGVTEIKARDFEAYHRVMPHSEYPSGSGCICIARAQFVDKLLKERHDIDDVPYDIPMFKAGSSVIEPGKTPKNDIEAVRLPNLTAMYELCGESRLWGGMHFEKAVTESYKLCDGVGEAGYYSAVGLLDGKPL